MTAVSAISTLDGEIFLTGRKVIYDRNTNPFYTSRQNRQFFSNLKWNIKEPQKDFGFRFNANCGTPCKPGPRGKQILLRGKDKVMVYFPGPQSSHNGGQLALFDSVSYQAKSIPLTEPRPYDARNNTVYSFGENIISVAIHNSSMGNPGLVFGLIEPSYGRYEYIKKNISFYKSIGQRRLNFEVSLDSQLKASIGNFKVKSKAEKYLFVTVLDQKKVPICVIFNLDQKTGLPKKVFKKVSLDYADNKILPYVLESFNKEINLFYIDKKTSIPMMRTLKGVGTISLRSPRSPSGKVSFKSRKVVKSFNHLESNKKRKSKSYKSVSFQDKRKLAFNKISNETKIIDMATAYRLHEPVQVSENRIEQRIDLVLFLSQGVDNSNTFYNAKVYSYLQHHGDLVFDLESNPCPGFEGKFWMSGNKKMHNQPMMNWILPGAHDAGAYSFSSRVDDEADSGAKDIANMNDYAVPLHGNPFTEGFYVTAVTEDVNTYIKKPGMSAIRSLAVAQRTDIARQLADGIRAFDFRVYFDKNSEAYVHHTTIGVKYENIFKQIQAFLKQTKGEIAVLMFSHFHHADQVRGDQQRKNSHEKFVKLLEKYFAKYAVQRKSKRPFMNHTYAEIMNKSKSSKVVIVYDLLSESNDQKDKPAIDDNPNFWQIKQFWGNFEGNEVPATYANASKVDQFIANIKNKLLAAKVKYNGPKQLWYTLTPQDDETNRIVRTKMYQALPKKYKDNKSVVDGVLGGVAKWNGSWQNLANLVNTLQRNRFHEIYNSLNANNDRFSIIWMDFYQQNPLSNWFKQTPPPENCIERTSTVIPSGTNHSKVLSKWKFVFEGGNRRNKNRPFSLEVMFENSHKGLSILAKQNVYLPDSKRSEISSGNKVIITSTENPAFTLKTLGRNLDKLRITPIGYEGELPDKIELSELLFQAVGRCETTMDKNGFKSIRFAPTNPNEIKTYFGKTFTWTKQEWINKTPRLARIKKRKIR